MSKIKKREYPDDETLVYHFRKISAIEPRRMVKNWTKEYMEHCDEIDKLDYFQLAK